MPTLKAQAARLWRQLPFFVWLVLLWMMLWGQVTVLSVLTGVIVAVLVTRIFHLPTAALSGRLNLWYGLVFIVLFLGELVRGAVTVAWQALSPGTTPSGIVRVPLRTDDDLIMTHVAVTASLIPGSLVVETDRERRVLYLHVLGIRSAADADTQRRGVLLWEDRIVRAVGSRADLEAIRHEREEGVRP